MDDLLVFSHQSRIKCCTFFSKEQILLADDTGLTLFDIGKARPIMESVYAQELHPISIWVTSNKLICLQGKMGFNYVYECDFFLKTMKQVRKYPTRIYGFCKMVLLDTDKLLGVSEQLKSIGVFDMINGNLIYKRLFEDEMYCQSISCIAYQQKENQKSKLSVYLGQQDCKIHHVNIDLSSNNEEEAIEVIQSLAIEDQQEIKIINCLAVAAQKMYALIRKQQCLYILSLQPKLSVLEAINFDFSMPKELKILPSTKQNRKQVLISDKNKLITVDIVSKKVTQQVQIKQSKSIEYLATFEQGICGNTQQRQFFHLQI